MAEARAMFGIPDRGTTPPPQAESPPELIPAAARWEMLKNSQGVHVPKPLEPGATVQELPV